MTVWRLQTKTKGRLTKYCYENNVAAVGWSFCNEKYVSEEERLRIQFFKDYCDLAKKINPETNKPICSSYRVVEKLANEILPGDLIWIRDLEGIYYIGRFGENSEWIFNNDAYEIDACNQRTDVDWKKVGDESSVPGAVATSFIARSTLQRINKDGVLEYSALIYDELAGTSFYSDIKLELNEENFYSLLSPSDCEDLLYSWLYHKYKYICIPSSNKINTPNYECVLLNPKNGNHIYIQVKKGDDSKINKIDADNYTELNGEVWFLKTNGRVNNIEKYKNYMHEANSTELFEFACSEKAKNIISPNIKKWVEFLCNQSNKKINGKTKGIIFDTNKSYEADGEKEMFRKNQIIAWGDARKYIDSFNLNDYVLYYSKGNGIVAIGKITTPPEECDNKKFCNVEMIVSPHDYENTNCYITASELKKVLKKSFYFASTRKVPFISEDEAMLLAELLRKKQNLA